MNNYHPDAEQLLYGNYIKYERLYHLSKQAFYGNNSTNIDIYLDMNSLIRVLYRYTDNMLLNDYSVITSSLINLCGHLRNYYWTRHQVYSKFFIIYGDNNPSIILPGYNKLNLVQDSMNQFLTGVLEENKRFLSTLCPYLNDIFFIARNKVETSVVIYDLICKNANPGVPKMIITKDPYAYQLVSMAPNTFVFRPKKTNDNANRQQIDVSWCVTKNTIFEMYQTNELHNKPIDFENSIINHELFSLLVSIAGYKCRDVKSTMRFSTAYNTIAKLVVEGKILSGYNIDIDYVISNIQSTPNINFGYIAMAFKSIDLITQHMIYQSGLVDYTKEIVNMYSPEEVKAINNRYFKNNPLDLQWL